MNRWVMTLAVIGIALGSCTDTGHRPSAPDATAAEPAGECSGAVDKAFRAWERAGFSGSIAVSTRGELECQAGYGWADRASDTPNTADTVFSIGSVSKAFTAAAAVSLVDAGRLRLDDRAGDLVPELRGPAARATVRQLLLHTSGLTGSHGEDHQPLSRRRAIETIGDLELAFAPGTDYAYSNAGYTLLSLIIESASGESYRGYLASRILTLPDDATIGGFWDGEPAAPGPRATGYLDDGATGETGDFAGPHWALAGNGDIAMTMPDLATWTHALFTDQLLSPAAVDVIRRPGFNHGDGTSETPGWVAIDESLFGEPVRASSGGGGDIGHNTIVAWLPDSERVIAIASNTPKVSAGDLLRKLTPALVAGDPLPTPDAPDSAIDPAELAAVAGRYELGRAGSFDVVAGAGRLEITAHGRAAVPALFPMPQGVRDASAAVHEERVMAMLAGETAQGRQERRALESELGGTITGIEPVGTIVDGGELRTYVTVDSASESMLAWYAVDEAGGVAAVMIGADPPSRSFIPTGDGAYRLDDPAGTAPEVVAKFDGRRLTISGPDVATSARRTT